MKPTPGARSRRVTGLPHRPDACSSTCRRGGASDTFLGASSSRGSTLARLTLVRARVRRTDRLRVSSPQQSADGGRLRKVDIYGYSLSESRSPAREAAACARPIRRRPVRLLASSRPRRGAHQPGSLTRWRVLISRAGAAAAAGGRALRPGAEPLTPGDGDVRRDGGPPPRTAHCLAVSRNGSARSGPIQAASIALYLCRSVSIRARA